MSPFFEFGFLLFSHLLLLLLLLPLSANGINEECPKSFECGNLGSFHFPFAKAETPNCGLLVVHGCDDPNPNSVKQIQLEKNGKLFLFIKVLDQQKNVITVFDNDIHNSLKSADPCKVLHNNITIPADSPLISFHLPLKVTIFRCNRSLINIRSPKDFTKHRCPDYDFYRQNSYLPINTRDPAFSPCSLLQLPIKDFFINTPQLASFVSSNVVIEVRLSDDCDNCYNHRGGQCHLDHNNKFFCDKVAGDKKSKILKLVQRLGIGLSIGVSGILLIWWLLKSHLKRKYGSSNSTNMNNNGIDGRYSNNGDEESGIVYFGVPLFSYDQLQKATNNFDPSKQLGSGGFGTVYYGKLEDGREVAVKRLYENNYRRVEQFMNEIDILTRLRHQNLVSLYGCTSRHSRELLLVYEYIPNGTVSCHLHGHHATSSPPLPWHVRLKIAIETASALAYLHASDTIHRDVKTNNILLHSNFTVKVADFGFSRLFPNDVSHVSTAPQGTPGYVDPEYYQCYQLTSKSDVYSFGVVLMELISSLPAVDMNRHKDEINLANLAIKRIQNGEFGRMVDSNLGFESDRDVRRMIVSVAELGFQCLQRDKEMRPSMEEVLEILRRIESGEDDDDEEHVGILELDSGPIHPSSPNSPNCEDETAGILLNKVKSLPSPKAVTDKWYSDSTITHEFSA